VRKRRESASIWAVRIATVSGIPIRLHFTFILFMLWLAFISRGTPYSTHIILLIPAIFLCVVLHELGHAITGQRFGIQTKDITLYPIGGIAALAGRPKPTQEFWIAIAGPSVNLIISFFVGISILFFEKRTPDFSVALSLERFSFWDALFSANIVLMLFNLIPAFPMDGGRVLRALLALRMPETTATQIAGWIGQFLAIAFGIFALFIGHVLWMLIAFFVFLGAGQEMAITIGYSLVKEKRIADAMMTDFRTLSHTDTLRTAAQLLLAGSQQVFPVVFGDEILGILTREDIGRGVQAEGDGAYVSGFMQREFKRLSPSDPLEIALNHFMEGDRTPLMIFDENRLVGILTIENLSEFMMLEQARGGNTSIETQTG